MHNLTFFGRTPQSIEEKQRRRRERLNRDPNVLTFTQLILLGIGLAYLLG
jgi:hypothetical protein